jgi:3'-phosphoadenosine 5'-phosphosulfate sulfotransferase (PAPS reductase)/FAD synthetase
MIVSWFSAGVSSAVATKLKINKIDKIIYTHIDDQHPDTLRFIKDCEKWFGKKIEILQSPYKSVENACRMSGGRGYVNGAAGAVCSRLLKRRVRKEWEIEQTELLTYIWGLDCNEKHRAERIIESMPEQQHVFPLIENNITKQEAHQMLNANNIKRPVMYDLGYNNNNCIGCVKGGKGYWNHIRIDFPEVFKKRAEMERFIHGTCIKGIYLDELDPESGRHTPPIVDDCGILCETLVIDNLSGEQEG